MIAAHRLTRRFGRILAVDGVDFEVPPGEVVGFLGPNGAGKTTTIRMICGYLRPTSGEVTVCGVSVTDDRIAAARRVGYLPESAPAYPEMRVHEYLGYRCRLAGVPRRQRTAAIERSMERCRLDEVRRRPIQQLSKGFRQRVGLAATLLHEPEVLVLDEPTSGLDPRQIRSVRTLVRELAGERTILISTHILNEVEHTCDRAIVIARGRVRRQGTIEELRRSVVASARYVVETKMDGAEARLGRLPQVRSVEGRSASEGWQRLTVTAAAGAGDLREPIAAALSGGGTIRELRREVGSLEQLFVEIAGDCDGEEDAP